MREIVSRLRAALTPQALLLLAAILLLAFGITGRSDHEASSLERRIEYALSGVEGAGHVDVVIRTKRMRNEGAIAGAREETVVCGAAVVAQGADDPLVRFELEQAMCALLDLPPSAVSVMTGGE